MNIKVKKNNKWGYFDTDTNKTIECKYLRAYNYEGGYAIVQEESYKYGVIDTEGVTIIPFIYDKIERESDVSFRIFVNELSCLVNNVGDLLDDDHKQFSDVLQEYDAVKVITSGVYVVAKGGNLGVYRNDKDTEVIPCNYFSISLLDTIYLVVGDHKRCFGIVNTNGEIIIPLNYKEVGRINPNLLYGKKYSWDFYSNKGELKSHIDNKWDTIKSIESIGENLFWVNHKQGSFKANLLEGTVLLNSEGSEVRFKLDYDYYGTFQNGICEVGKNNSFGLIDLAGNELVPCEYSKIEYNEKYAFLKRIISGRYTLEKTTIELFSLSKKKIISSKKYTSVSLCNDGFAIVYCDEYSQYGLINPDGVETLTSLHSIKETEDPSVVCCRGYQGIQYYRKTGEHVFKNSKGQYKLLPQNIISCGSFSEGLAIVTDNGKDGFINEEGVIAIPCKFGHNGIVLSGFSAGVATIAKVSIVNFFEVKETGVYCFIDKKGDFIVTYKKRPIIIADDALQFIFPFEGEVARAIDSNGLWGVIAPSGRRVSSFKYDDIQPFQDNNAIVKIGKMSGVVDDRGNCIVPVKFTDIRRDGDVFVAKEGTLDNAGHFIVKGILLDNSVYDECSLFGGVFIKVRKGDQFGLLDSSGGVLLPCEYSEVGMLENGYIHCKRESDSVLIAPSGEIIKLPAEIDTAKYYPNGIVYIENKGGKKSIISIHGGQLLTDIGFNVIDIKYNLIIYSNRNDYPYRQGVLDIIGNEIVPCKFKSLRFDNVPNSFIATYDDYEQRYDTHGNKVSALNASLIILDDKYSACGDYQDGLAPVAIEISSGNYRKLLWGYIDHSGNEVISCNYLKASGFSCGLAKVYNHDLYGFIDKAGNEQIPYKYREASDFVDGYSAIKAKNNASGVINLKGEYVISPNQYEYTDVFYNGLALSQKRNHRYGFLNEDGKIVIPFVFKSATPFIDGFSEVTFDDWEKQKYKIDTHGNLVISLHGKDYTLKVDLTKFSHLGPFYNGKAAISYKPGNYGIISIDGTMVVEPKFGYIFVSPNGNFGIKIKKKDLYFTKDGKNLVDDAGNIMPISDNYLIEALLCEGRYIVNGDKGKGVINEKGILLTDCDFESIQLTSDKKHFSCMRKSEEPIDYDEEGNAIYEEYSLTFNLNGERVILDNEKEYIIPKKYESYKDFLPNGLGPVMRKGKWGFIDKNMKEIIECKYINYNWLDDRYCVVVGGHGHYEESKALITSSGKYVLTPGRYKEITPFEEECFFITMYPFSHKYHDLNNRSIHSKEENVYDVCMIDKDGRLLLPINEESVALDKKYKWYIKNSDGTISVFDGDHWGLLDSRIKEYIPCTYNKAFQFKDSLAVVTAETGTGVIDSAKKIIIPLIYNNVVIHTKMSLMYAVKGDHVTVFNTKGEIQGELNCREIYPLSKDYSKFKRLKDEENRWKGLLSGFVCHKTGKECFGYDDVGCLEEGLISVKKGDKWGYVNLEGELIIPYEYIQAWPFHNGRALVSKNNDKDVLPSGGKSFVKNIFGNHRNLWGIIGIDGSVIAPHVYYEPEYIKNTEYKMIVAHYGEVETYLNINGDPLSITGKKKLVAIPGYYACGEVYNHGRQIVYGKDGIGFVDESGNLVIKCRDFGSSVHGPMFLDNGSLEVHFKTTKNNELKKSMDDSGSVITIKDGQSFPIPFQYIYAKEWVGNYIPVMIGDCWGVIDGSRNEIIPCIYQDIFIVKDKAVAKLDTGYFIIDLINKESIEVKYDDVSKLNDDYLLVLKKKPQTDVERFSYGYRSQKPINYYGVIDLKGKVVIDAIFSEISINNPNPEKEEDEEIDSFNELDNSYYEDTPSYGRYAGTYAQDEAGLSDDAIDEALEGDPDAYWNID